MTDSVNSDSIFVDLPSSLNPEQITALPLATNIGEGNLLTATKIATAYNIPASTGAGVKVGIISLGGGFSQADLNKSMSDLGLVTGNVTFVPVDDANNTPVTGSDADIENALDLVCVAGMVPAANIVLYKAGGVTGVYYNGNSSIAVDLNKTNSFANAIQKAVDENCDVISISWGYSEKKVVSGITQYVGDFLAGPLANAAAKNISVFVAAGDYGSQAVNSANPAFQIVSTDYPSVNTNVTAVGGTYLTLGVGNSWASETVYNNSGVGGGGGVSSMVPRPAYQRNLTYKNFPSNVVVNLGSRGIPDISAAMNAYGLWLGNTVRRVSGTSASAPIMAGMVARFISLNGGRRPPGGSTGLNTIFYQNPGSFRDIQTGNNASLLPSGYAATVGWDATVGYGPPANAVQTYQSVTSAGLGIKTDTGWQKVQNIQVKTATNTWTNVAKVWVKTQSGWRQTY